MTIGVRSVEKSVRSRRVILDISVWSVLTGRLMNMDGDIQHQTYGIQVYGQIFSMNTRAINLILMGGLFLSKR